MRPRRPLQLAAMTAALVIALASCGCWDSPTAPSRTPLWDVPISHTGGMFGQPGIVDGVLVAPIGPDGGRMQGLDAATGQSRWTAPMTSLDCAPVVVRVHQGVAYIAGCNGATAYNARTGQLLWTTRLPDHPKSFARFAVDSSSVYVADLETSRVSALAVSTGVRRWTWRDSTSIASQVTRVKATVATRGKAYVVGVREIDANRVVQGVIIELDGASGTELRRFTTPDSTSDYRAGTSDEGGRLVLSNAGRSGLDAFDLDAWRLAWRIRRPGGFIGPWTDPSISDGVVYSGWQHGDAVAIDLATGRELWGTGVRGGIYNVVACRNEVVAQHFALTWFDRRTGKVRASNPFEGSSEFPVSDLVTDGERIYVISNSRAYAYRCE